MSKDMSQQNNTEEYDEEEVEVSDTEEGAEIEEEVEGGLGVEEEQGSPVIVTPPEKTLDNPGKVKPSKQVKDMKLKSPETIAGASASTLPVGKNPFPIFGAWTEATISEIEIIVPVLTGKNESTNELTRSNKPEARYWKAPIVFKYGNFTSTTLRFDNVPIPFHTGKGYGSNFIYLCLPGAVGEKFAEAGKSRRPTIVTEKSLQPDRNRWWKVANNVEESFGIINKDTKKFHKKSLDVVFDATNSGITATVVLSFLFKASTDSKEPLKPTTGGTISVNLERAFLVSTDVSVQMPVRLNNKKQKVDPSATSKDVANDSLMKRLSELGL